MDYTNTGTKLDAKSFNNIITTIPVNTDTSNPRHLYIGVGYQGISGDLASDTTPREGTDYGKRMLVEGCGYESWDDLIAYITGKGWTPHISFN